jgi:hypothetical protein
MGAGLKWGRSTHSKEGLCSITETHKSILRRWHRSTLVNSLGSCVSSLFCLGCPQAVSWRLMFLLPPTTHKDGDLAEKTQEAALGGPLDASPCTYTGKLLNI